jgi:hypothetical protein
LIEKEAMTMNRYTLAIAIITTLLTASCAGEDGTFVPGYKIAAYEEDHQWTSIGCIARIDVVFSSGITVRNSIVAEMVFQQFVEYSEAQEEEILLWGPEYQLEKAEPYGIHGGLKYWRVMVSRDVGGQTLTAYSGIVSEKGDVVLMLGCI